MTPLESKMKILTTLLRDMKFSKKEREKIYDFMNDILEKKLIKKETKKKRGRT